MGFQKYVKISTKQENMFKKTSPLTKKFHFVVSVIVSELA